MCTVKFLIKFAYRLYDSTICLLNPDLHGKTQALRNSPHHIQTEAEISPVPWPGTSVQEGPGEHGVKKLCVLFCQMQLFMLFSGLNTVVEKSRMAYVVPNIDKRWLVPRI